MSGEQEDKSGTEGTYFQQWYVENGDDLNQKRRDRYNTDPAYKERILEQNREARKKRRKEKIAEKRKNRGSKTTNEAKNWKSVVIELTDEKTGQKVAARMFTIGAVAKALGCSVQAIRLWEKRGGGRDKKGNPIPLIPPAPYRYSKGDRLYTEEFIELLRKILTEKGRIGVDKPVRAKSLPYLDRKVQHPSKTGKPKGVVRNTRLYKIGLLAKAVDRTVVTLEQLEQRGALPKTPFRVSDVGYRLYTQEMMEAVKSAFESRAGEIRGKIAWAEFYDEIFEAWSGLNVIGAWIIE